jgi:hypothetical protein
MATKIQGADFTELIQFLNTYGEQVVAEMRTRLRNDGKVASEALYDSIRHIVTNNPQDGIQLNFELLDYYIFVDKGINGVQRNVGSPYSFKYAKPSRKMARAIGQWRKIKGVQANEWAIATNIKKRGIRPTQFFSISTRRRQKFLEKKVTELLDKALNGN